MLKFKPTPFEEDIEKATHENNLSEDWSLIMHICDNATNYQDGAKYCFKAIMKRLHHNVPRVVLLSLTLLDACVKNCDRKFLLLIASSEFTTEVRKLLPKMHPSAAIKFKELIQRWSLQEFKDDPELCIIPALYYKLKSEGVEFPPINQEKKKEPALCTNPDGVSSQEEENDIIKALELSLKDTGKYEINREYNTVAPEKPLPEPFKARTLYDFDAAEDNELTIKAGEIVLVLDNSNCNWWKGSNHRGEGLFPANFVTEDLDFVCEDPNVAAVVVHKEEPELTLESEIKIDEKVIEQVLNWLNDTDPTIEANDPPEMLLMEKRCYLMNPLIEENLQAIDNKLAKLSLVNEKIMKALEIFHSLSDQWAANFSMNYPHHMPFPYSQIAMNSMPFIQQTSQNPHLPMTSAQSNIQVDPQSTAIQTVASKEIPISVHRTTVQDSLSSNQQVEPSLPTTASRNFSSQSNTSDHSGLVSSFSAAPQMFPQHSPMMQASGFPSGPLPNMPFPYAVPSLGPYFPYQYYASSQITTPSNVAVTASGPTSNPNLNSANAVTTNVNTSAAQISTYSTDLHHLNLNVCSTVDQTSEMSSASAAEVDKQLQTNEAKCEPAL